MRPDTSYGEPGMDDLITSLSLSLSLASSFSSSPSVVWSALIIDTLGDPSKQRLSNLKLSVLVVKLTSISLFVLVRSLSYLFDLLST